MHRKLVSVVMLSVLVLNMAALVFDVRPVKAAGTIYIHADGSIDPPSAPIATSDNRTYLLTDNTLNSIVIERNNTMFHGNNYTVQGSGSGVGFDLNSVTNVTVEDTRIVNFQLGVNLHNSAPLNHVLANTLVQNQEGIEVSSSNDNHIWANNIVNCSYVGIFVDNGSGNTVEGNHVWGGGSQGIQLADANSNILLENTIEYCSQGLGINFSSYNNVKLNVIKNSVGESGDGVFLAISPFNTLIENTVTANSHGVGLVVSNDSSFYHNNFINNTQQVYDYSYSPPYLGAPRSCNAWDNGYPWGGNYWSSYNGTDLYKGPHQNETGSDGIGDTPYPVDVNNRDNYPLMQPWSPHYTRYAWPMFHHDNSHSGYSESPAPRTNQTVWIYPVGGGVVRSSPAVTDGRVYIGSLDNRVYCLDASTGAQIWNYTTGGEVWSSPSVADGRVYVGSENNGRVFCLDALTGAQIWNYTTGATVLQTSPAVADGRVYVVSKIPGSLCCLDASNGSSLWNFTTGNWFYASPTVACGKVYVTDGFPYLLHCLDAVTGAPLWNFNGAGGEGSPAVVGDRVFEANSDMLYCLNALTGSSIWTFTTRVGGIITSPAVAYDRVYVVSGAYLFCVNTSDGLEVWNCTMGPGTGYSSPAVADGKVYVAITNSFYCVDAFSGSYVWDYVYDNTGTRWESSPAIADGVVYVGGYDAIVSGCGKLWAFGNIVRVPEDYGTVQEAIDAVPQGGTVWVAPGIYHESLVINKTITLIGKPGSEPIFGGGGSGIAITIVSTGSGSVITGITITNWAQGIVVDGASGCKIYDNIMSIINNYGITVQGATAVNNQICSNIFDQDAAAIHLTSSSQSSTVSQNIISMSTTGLILESSGNTVYENVVAESVVAITMINSNNNKFYHNNFVNNNAQLSVSGSTGNVWDDGYPSGGNYWSSHDNTDNFNGAQQNFPGSDGIADSSYSVVSGNVDHYPLAQPFAIHNIGITNFVQSKPVIGQPLPPALSRLQISMWIRNLGMFNETFALILRYNTTTISSQVVSLNTRNSTTFNFALETAGLAKGKYTLSACAGPVQGENNVADNTFTTWFTVTILGDVDGNFKVDMGDIVLILDAFGSSRGQPRYNPNHDFDDNTHIDMGDVVTALDHFGQHYP